MNALPADQAWQVKYHFDEIVYGDPDDDWAFGEPEMDGDE